MILALDTSGDLAVVAMVRDGILIHGGVGTRPRAHAEELAPLLEAALRAGEPERVVVGRGPGFFTGLRVGLVTAQVLGWTWRVPVSGLCSLDAVAAQFALRDGCAVTDARRGELFWARYRAGSRVAGPFVAARLEVARETRGELVVGDVGLIDSPDRRARGTTRLDPAALAVATAAGGAEPATPVYLRRPDVTMAPGR